jgi:hypothetical protein
VARIKRVAWYNTYSHDLYVVAANSGVAQLYLQEFHQTLRDFRLFA